VSECCFVVFGVEKLVTSKLYEAGANKRIFNIDRQIGMVCSYKKEKSVNKEISLY
jgi:hypothetical protein